MLECFQDEVQCSGQVLLGECHVALNSTDHITFKTSSAKYRQTGQGLALQGVLGLF